MVNQHQVTGLPSLVELNCWEWFEEVYLRFLPGLRC
jgi:hypothetical protein